MKIPSFDHIPANSIPYHCFVHQEDLHQVCVEVSVICVLTTK